MSGGVDSSVAALLLQRDGHEVVGVFMRNGVSSDGPAKEKSCCSASDARDASTVAERLGVPFYSVDYAEEFGSIIDHFASEYRLGRTPNPCVLCNQKLKFGHLFQIADSIGAEKIATGHYARVEDGRLLRSVDQAKDQTYYLFGVEREALPRATFPLGAMTKAQVREVAREAGMVTAEKPESMDICFVTSGDYRDVVRTRGGVGRAGQFVSTDGAVLGEHDGVGGFTIGQRRGLPALGKPYYVRAIRPADGEVVLCTAEGLEDAQALCSGVNWLVDTPSAEGLDCQVMVRARMQPVAARIQPDAEDPSKVQVRFADSVRAVTPGQAAVFYDGPLVLGGGWID